MENEEGGVKHPYQEKEPLEPHPGGVNPTTGEIGGPRGPEPTRYGDWERKGRVTDFWVKNCTPYWYQNFDIEMNCPRRKIKAKLRFDNQNESKPKYRISLILYLYYKLMKANTFRWTMTIEEVIVHHRQY